MLTLHDLYSPFKFDEYTIEFDDSNADSFELNKEKNVFATVDITGNVTIPQIIVDNVKERCKHNIMGAIDLLNWTTTRCKIDADGTSKHYANGLQEIYNDHKAYKHEANSQEYIYLDTFNKTAVVKRVVNNVKNGEEIYKYCDIEWLYQIIHHKVNFEEYVSWHDFTTDDNIPKEELLKKYIALKNQLMNLLKDNCTIVDFFKLYLYNLH